MSLLEHTNAHALLDVFNNRRSVRRLTHAAFPPGFHDDLRTTVQRVPSAFDTQPWLVVVLQERNGAFWDCVTQTIIERLEGDRRDRYLARAAGMRDGGVTLLIFEDIRQTGPRDNVSVEESRDHASQSLGMLQFALWLMISAHGLSTSLQHWEFLIEDVACTFAGLSAENYRLVTFMPVGHPVEPAPARTDRVSRLAVERAGIGAARTEL